MKNSREQFIREWNADPSESVAAVALRLGCLPASAIARAGKLRREGYSLVLRRGAVKGAAFAEIWNAHPHETAEELGKRLGMKPFSVSSRAARLRRHGVFLISKVSTSRISDDDFVRAWNEDPKESAASIAARIGYSRASVASRSSDLRRKGWVLILRRSIEVPREAFILAWNQDPRETLVSVCRRLGIKPHSATERASRLRAQGEELVRRPSGTCMKSEGLLSSSVASPMSDSEFVQVWNASKDPLRLAQDLGVTRNAVYQRASRLKKRGFEVLYRRKTNARKLRKRKNPKR